MPLSKGIKIPTVRTRYVGQRYFTTKPCFAAAPLRRVYVHFEGAR